MSNASLKVSSEVWGKVKVYCVTHGVKIQEWVERVLMAELNKNGAPQANTGQYVSNLPKE